MPSMATLLDCMATPLPKMAMPYLMWQCLDFHGTALGTAPTIQGTTPHHAPLPPPLQQNIPTPSHRGFLRGLQHGQQVFLQSCRCLTAPHAGIGGWLGVRLATESPMRGVEPQSRRWVCLVTTFSPHPRLAIADTHRQCTYYGAAGLIIRALL